MGMPQGGQPWEAGTAGWAGDQQQESYGRPEQGYGREPESYGPQQEGYGRQPESYGAQQGYGSQQQGYGRQEFEGGGRRPGATPDGRGWGEMPGRPQPPVNEDETRVTGRRVVQYIIDYAITGAVASVILWALDRGTGAANAVLVLVGAVLAAAWYFWYWVYRPYHSRGQSFGMQLLGLRIISKDGGRASMGQLLIRGILLIVDTLVWGLVGLITILCSRYRQRVGDHAARTLVVRGRVQPRPAPRSYMGAGAEEGSFR